MLVLEHCIADINPIKKTSCFVLQFKAGMQSQAVTLPTTFKTLRHLPEPAKKGFCCCRGLPLLRTLCTACRPGSAHLATLT